MGWDPDTKTFTITTTDSTITAQTEYKDEAVTIRIDGSSTIIGDDAFKGYLNLENLILPDSIQTIKNNIIVGTKIRSFHIPFSTKELSTDGPFDWTDYLEEFTIDPNHPNFCVIDGVLYSKDRKILYCIPGNYNRTTFTVPFDVVEMYNSAMNNLKNINRLIFPQTVVKPRSIFYYAKSKDPRAIVYRWPSQSNSTFPLPTGNFSGTDYPINSSVDFVYKNYYPTFYASTKTIVITTRNDFLKERFNDTYFENFTDISTVIVGKGIRYLDQSSFSNSSQITYIFKNQGQTIPICHQYTIRTYLYVFIVMLL